MLVLAGFYLRETQLALRKHTVLFSIFNIHHGYISVVKSWIRAFPLHCSSKSCEIILNQSTFTKPCCYAFSKVISCILIKFFPYYFSLCSDLCRTISSVNSIVSPPVCSNFITFYYLCQ